MKLKKNAKIFFSGIAGTGMASLAGLMQKAGYTVAGSDQHIYPPTSNLLNTLKITVFTPYSKENIQKFVPDLVVIGNSLSKDHPEASFVVNQKIPYISFAKLLGEYFLSEKTSIVVAGTHGKTTTTSMLSFLLDCLDLEPSFLIGGVSEDLGTNHQLKKGPYFVVEGDEYDTAFFDKSSKFLHYKADYLILNNIEFDHADIFPDLAAIEDTFAKLITQIKDPAKIIANIDDPGVLNLLKRMQLEHKVTAVAAWGKNKQSSHGLVSANYEADNSQWTAKIRLDQKNLAFSTSLSGLHNLANLTQVLTCLWKIHQDHPTTKSFQWEKILQSLRTARGVKKRFEHLGSQQDIEVYEDFAHHPTAVQNMINSLRIQHPKRRLLLAFEPKNASSRRNIFMNQYIKTLAQADLVFIAPCPQDKRIQIENKMNTDELAKQIGEKAAAFSSHEILLEDLLSKLQRGDIIVFMSCGSFAQAPQKLLKQLRKTKVKTNNFAYKQNFPI